MNNKEKTKKIKILNKLGIHARVAAKIVEITSKHNSALFIRKNDREVEGSNILSILTLDCPMGTEVEIRAIGDDSDELLEEVSQVLIKGLDSIDERSGK
jgi:phosphocarrier protein